MASETVERAAGVVDVARRPRPLSMLASSVSVMGGKVATMGLGFVFWVLAARTFAQDDVGLAAGAVSAMMLCTQIAVLGLGSGVITQYPTYADRPKRLLNSALTLGAAAAAALCVVVFALLASGALPELAILARNPVFAPLFLVMTVAGTLGIILDQTAIAIRRGEQVLIRGLAFGGVTLGVLAMSAAAFSGQGAIVILAPFAIASVGVCLLAAVQLHRSLGGYRYSPSIDRPFATSLIRSSLPNYALTLTERAPGLIIPVVVVEILSPEVNAAWYAAWMMAWVLYFVPISSGLTLFAEATHNPDGMRAAVRQSLVWSIAIGSAGAAVMVLAAPMLLSILGERYADMGTQPLRILAIAVLPIALTQAYFAVSRACAQLREALIAGAICAVVSVALASFAGWRFGLTGIATAWLYTQTAMGLWSGLRLRALLAPEAPGQLGPRLRPRMPALHRAPSAVVGSREGRPATSERGLAWRAARVVLSLAIPAAAIPLWVVSFKGISIRDLGDLGVVSAAPKLAAVPFLMVAASFCAHLAWRPFSSGLLLVHVTTMVVMLYGVRPLIEEEPAFRVTWRHAGVVEYVTSTGGVDTSIDAYFNWPVFFILTAFVVKLGGLSSALDLASWAPVVFNLLYLGPLLMIFRAATNDRRVWWLGVWFFYLANWIGQDYLSPQGLALFLHLVFLAIVLHWFDPKGLGRGSKGSRVGLLAVAIVVFAAIVPSHQLTPFATLFALIALAAARRTSQRGLVIIAAVFIGAWMVFGASAYLSGHIDNVAGQVGNVGATLDANVSERLRGSTERLIVQYGRLAFTAGLWITALVGALRLRKRRRLNPAHALLALTPLALLGLQSYGGEMLLRAYLFGLPFVALLAASAFFPARSAGRGFGSFVAVTAASLVALSAFSLTRYGNERIDQFTHEEVAAVEHLYAVARPGSVFVVATGNVPWKYRDYGAFDYRIIADTPEWQARRANGARQGAVLDAVVESMRSHRSKGAYLLLTRGQHSEVDLMGAAPRGELDRFEREITKSPRFLQLYANRDAAIYILSPQGRGQTS